jgi:cobalt/nickel transport protein
MKIFSLTVWALVVLAAITGSASAHFGMVIPSKNIITPDNKNLHLTLSFSHPFERIGMDLEKPARFFMHVNGHDTDLLATLQPATVMEHRAWQTDMHIKRPGVYWFAMVPRPYWEPAEDLYIIHYTKTVAAAFGDDRGWDVPLGLETEIVPLLRPFGNYRGNSFSGQVLIKGKPAANTDVEVELYNREGRFSAPGDYHVTQVVKTDANGMFTFTCPQSGWWGFSALSEADYTLKGPDGKDKNVEIGAILWIYLDEYETAGFAQ